MTRKVTIVGLGALGSHLIQFARNWDVKFNLVDFDRIEQKNVASQFHSWMGLRKNKASALKQALRGMFGTKVDVSPHKLTSDNVDVILGSSDLVIDCTDNAETRRLIQKFVQDNNIPCLHGCLSATGDLAQITWTEYFVVDEEGEAGAATCEDGEQLPFFALAGAQIAMIAQDFLETGKKKSLQLLPFNLIRLT